MDISKAQSAWLLLVALLPALWVIWSDLKYMRISNRIVLITAGLFFVAGFALLPFDTYLWRLLNLVVVLVIGFIMNALRLIGGGDAKYAAAIAPFFAASDFRLVILLFAGVLLAAFFTHRLFGRIPAIRSMTSDWVSWQSGSKFPMGLALSGTLLFYLAFMWLGR